MQTLNTIPVGVCAEVKSFDLSQKITLRLQALGMIPGTRVKVLQKKGKGTLILDVRGARFALGRHITDHIEVAV